MAAPEAVEFLKIDRRAVSLSDRPGHPPWLKTDTLTLEFRDRLSERTGIRCPVPYTVASEAWMDGNELRLESASARRVIHQAFLPL
jgi:hypothetical protein